MHMYMNMVYMHRLFSPPSQFSMLGIIVALFTWLLVYRYMNVHGVYCLYGSLPLLVCELYTYISMYMYIALSVRLSPSLGSKEIGNLSSMFASAHVSVMYTFLCRQRCVCLLVSSLQDVSLDADIPLSQVLQFASHLVHWGKAMTIYPLSESNVYIASSTAETRVLELYKHMHVAHTV